MKRFKIQCRIVGDIHIEAEDEDLAFEKLDRMEIFEVKEGFHTTRLETIGIKEMKRND